MTESFEFADPERLTVGTEGMPGQRMFFLQARQGNVVATLKMEKLQVAALAAWIAKTLEDLPTPGRLPSPDEMEPETFVEPAWVVGSLGGSYDTEADRIILVAAELTERDPQEEGAGESPGDDPVEGEDDARLRAALLGDDLPGERGATARFLTTREQMAALAIRATRLVESGRPPCPLCGYPLVADDHQCPRTNGHRPPGL